MDGKFEFICGDLANIKIHLNIYSFDKHIEEIERLNQTIKEIYCGIYNTIKFDKVPGQIIIDLVVFVVL